MAGWGKAIVEQLAQDIHTKFPGITGFSARNVWRMRDFYLSDQDNPKLTPMVAEIGWIHNLVILEKNKPIGVATDQMLQRLPQELQDQLPNPEQISQLLGEIE